MASSLRLGMIARADNRGLGTQTYDFYRHMKPDRTVVVTMGELSPYEEHVDRYPDAWGVRPRTWDDDVDMTRFLDGLDVVFTAETPYFFRLLEVARDMGVKTVVQGNFEFLGWNAYPELPRPDLFLAPSAWRLADWPEPKRLLPFPVDRDRFPFRLRRSVSTFLHVAGHPTRADRNGSWDFLKALHQVHMPIHAIVTCQEVRGLPTSLTEGPALPDSLNLELREGDVAEREQLYADADALVLPRRFGGQSLPMNEAASLGMPVLMTAVHPQVDLLPEEALCMAHVTRFFEGQGGRVAIADADIDDLASRMTRLLLEPEMVERLSRSSDLYAESIAWTTLRPCYEQTFAELAAS